MTVPAEEPAAPAAHVGRMCALDPSLGGVLLRGTGRACDAAVAVLTAMLPSGTRTRRLPVNVGPEQLDGGIDLAAALAGEPPRRVPGLLDGSGLLIVPMADRLPALVAARVAAAIDRGLRVVALDDGTGDVPVVLADRLAFWLDADRASAPEPPLDLGTTTVEAAAEALASAALALGVGSVRADLLALRVARALATSAGRSALAEGDITEAARLVLAPRATRLPTPPDAAPVDSDPVPEHRTEDGGDVRELADRLVTATQAAIDPDLLASLGGAFGRRGEGRRTQGPGERRRTAGRGRPIGTRAGDPRRGGRLALIETLRTAAPWQRLRGRTGRVLVRPSDLRIYRREARAETVAIFAIDASGSAAMARMAEAKGAVELLLGQAYVQRAEVALTAFRGTAAELLLPPTRSLARARRALADLPGGGGTPLASGIEAAVAVARAVRAKGKTATVVMLSDGRANIAADGRSGGRAIAEREAIAAAGVLKGERIAALFVDISPRPRSEGARLAEAMGARYLPLPFAGAHAIAAAVDAITRRPA